MEKKRLGIEELFSIEMPPQANYELPDPDMLDYWNDYNQRIIFINSDIDDTIDNTVVLYNIIGNSIFKANALVNSRFLVFTLSIAVYISCTVFVGSLYSLTRSAIVFKQSIICS